MASSYLNAEPPAAAGPYDGTTVAHGAHLYPNKLSNDIPTASTSALYDAK